MTDRTKTILISAAFVAAIYIAVEYYAKPSVTRMAGVKVK